jgi:dihydroflavonol-4-reductase
MGRIFITGATGLLGQTLIEELGKIGEKNIAAFVMQGDKLEKDLPSYVARVYGNILDKDSLRNAIQEGDAVIHLAALVSIQTKDNEKMKAINLGGTKNVVDVAMEKHCVKLVYVSSSHVLGYKKNAQIKESDFGGPTENIGAYETTKKEATAYVFSKAKEGLNASVIYPSGIISDRDYAMGEISTLLYKLASGKLGYFVKGGYAFVDAHDVAKALIAALKKGQAGQGYLISGGYMTLRQIDDVVVKRYPKIKRGHIVPFWLVYMILPFIMIHEKISKKKPLYTYMSLKTVRTEADFDTTKSVKELGLVYTPLETSLNNALAFIEKTTGLK